MPRTLADDRADDMERVFNNPDHFSVSLTYKPKSGVARSIVARVRTLPNEIVNEGNHQVEHRMILIRCQNDATEGIDDPQHGDSISYRGLIWSYVGESHYEPGGRLLKFSCPTILNTGPQNRFRL